MHWQYISPLWHVFRATVNRIYAHDGSISRNKEINSADTAGFWTFYNLDPGSVAQELQVSVQSTWQWRKISTSHVGVGRHRKKQNKEERIIAIKDKNGSGSASTDKHF